MFLRALSAKPALRRRPLKNYRRARTHVSPPFPDLCSACVRANMEFLASDALRGRGSATADELVAATYVASRLRAYGITPAGDNGGYLQRAGLLQPKFTAPPQLTFVKPGAGGEKVTWTCGKEFAAPYLAQSPLFRSVARDQRR